jgi:hypothetical protein
MKKWRPQHKGETQEQYEGRLRKFAAGAKARADKAKAKLNARHADGKNQFLADTTGVKRPASFRPPLEPRRPLIIPLPPPKDRNSSHLRGVPPDNIMRGVRRRYKSAFYLDDDQEMVTIRRLRTTVVETEAILRHLPRERGARLACKTLRTALGFLYQRKIPLRSGANSEAVRQYALKLATDEPQLNNPKATARSRLRRLTDLRRKQGFPEPTPGRKRK